MVDCIRHDGVSLCQVSFMSVKVRNFGEMVLDHFVDGVNTKNVFQLKKYEMSIFASRACCCLRDITEMVFILN